MSTRLGRGGVVVPNSIGEGLERGILNFINVRAARRAAESDEKFRERQLDAEERRLDANEQNNAFDRLLQIAPLFKEGSTLGDNPLLANLSRRAFGDLGDDELSALGDISLNRETFETILNDRRMKITSEADEDDPRLQRMINFSLFGEAVTDAELEARDAETAFKRKRTTVLSNAFDSLVADPETAQDFARTALGMQPNFSIPGFNGPDGQPLVFENETAARVYGASLELAFNREKLSTESRTDMVEGFISSALEADLALGRPKAMQIINAYEASTLGQFAPGQAPIEKLFASSDAETQRAIKLFTGTVRVGETRTEEFLRTLPNGERFLLANDIAGLIHEANPSANVSQLQRSVLNSLDGVGITLDKGFAGFGGLRYNFEEQATGVDPEARLPVGSEPGPSGLPPDADPNVVTMRSLIERGVPVEEAILSASEIIGEEAATAAADAAIQMAAREAGGTPPPLGSETSTAEIEDLTQQFISAIELRNNLSNEAREFFKGSSSGGSALAKKREANQAAAQARDILEQIRVINPARAQQLERDISR